MYSETDLSQFRFVHHKSLVDCSASVNKWKRERSVLEYLGDPLLISYDKVSSQFALDRLPAIHISSATTDAHRRRRHANHKQVFTQHTYIAARITIVMTDNYVWLRVNLLFDHQTAFS
jgi:hypothetical protein